MRNSRPFSAGVIWTTLLSTLASTCLAADAPAVVESARTVPVAGSADVIIVGGSTGAVSAAVAAAKAGSRVFLLAPRPYLGEDIAGPMRLWLEPGEQANTELAKQIFRVATNAKGVVLEPNAIQFRYEASVPSAAAHKDTNPPSRLSDGIVGDPVTDSVQYDSDVAIIADLRAVLDVKTVRLILFQRDGTFATGAVSAEISNDKREWKPAGNITKVEADTDGRATVEIPINGKARFVRLTAKLAADVKRQLLAEIAFTIPAGPAVVEAAPKPESPAPAADKRIGPFRPMAVKTALDEALLGAKVQYLYSTMVTDIVRDAKGNITGVGIANRAGRQVILGKVIIDATDRAYTARIAGAGFEPYPAGTAEFSIVNVGGKPKNSDSVVAKETGLAYPVAGGAKTAAKKGKPSEPVTSAPLIEHIVKVPMTDGSFASFARAEQAARDMTASDGVLFLTDEVFQLPPDPVKSAKRSTGAWEGAAKVDLDALKPAGLDRLWILGGSADVSREAAAKLILPTNLIELGERVGAAAAEQAKQIAAPLAAEVRVAGPAVDPSANAKVTVGESLRGLRPVASNQNEQVSSPARSLPVLGEYDVVVIGAGTGGAPAGISAARAKAKTLVIEYLHGMGGVGTAGRVSTYWHGYRGGFTATVPGLQSWDPIEKGEWWRAQVREAGGEIWYGCLGGGAVVENGKVVGVIVITPEKRGVVLCKTVIDATGNSDVARAAGAETVFLDPNEPAFQGTGLPPLNLGRQYTNTDFTIVDESDMMDVWHVLTFARRKYAGAFDMGQLFDTRERHRIVGEFTMTLTDAINQRTYPDTIHVAQSNFDTHGFTIDPYLMLEHPQKKDIRVNVPYRCLLPKGLDGILVIGLGVSAHRDVMPLLRMQPDIQNQGFAAGVIAATSARENKPLREINLAPIQEQLAEMEIIPRPFVAKDSYPLSDEAMAKAVADAKGDRGVAVIMAEPQRALPLLQKAYAAATSEKDKVTYARILAVLGDSTGIDTLIATVEAHEKWDAGWNYKGMGQFGHALSELDTMIVALGRTRDKRALPAIIKKVNLLEATHEFSHHRAVALALELIGDPSAVEPLAALLAKPNMQGYMTFNVDQAYKASGNDVNDNKGRATSIREVSLARALYRCGDKDGLGKKILTEYSKDLRGYLARHAEAVLAAK